MSNEEIEKRLKEAMDLFAEKKQAEAKLIFEELAEQGNKEAQAILAALKKMEADGSGANRNGKMTFNYLLTHKELPKLFFSSLDNFYETIMPSSEMFMRFFDFAFNRAKYFVMESPDKYTEPFSADDKFKIELVGKTKETSIIVVGIPQCEEICDCFQVAFTCAKENPRYFTCEFSRNPMTDEDCVIVGEWKQKGEGLSHLNYGLLDTKNKESFAGRVIQIAYNKLGGKKEPLASLFLNNGR